MKYIIPIIPIIIIILCYSCRETMSTFHIDKDKTKAEINQLETIELQTNYLEELYEIDQSTRKNVTKVEQEYGYYTNSV